MVQNLLLRINGLLRLLRIARAVLGVLMVLVVVWMVVLWTNDRTIWAFLVMLLLLPLGSGFLLVNRILSIRLLAHAVRMRRPSAPPPPPKQDVLDAEWKER